MPLNTQQRLDFLDTLHQIGGDPLRSAGLDMLKQVDQGGADPKPPATKLSQAQITAIKAIPPGKGGFWQKLICGVCCAAHLPDPVATAACVYNCIMGNHP